MFVRAAKEEKKTIACVISKRKAKEIAPALQYPLRDILFIFIYFYLSE
jgi:hypothetical protein